MLPHSRLLYIYDQVSGRRFLIDTGAAASIYPATAAQRNAYTSQSDQNQHRLVAANGTEIRTYGKRTITVNLDVIKTSWSFIIADVRQPLLGADFLSANNLLVDVRGRRVVNGDTCNSSRLEDW